MCCIKLRIKFVTVVRAASVERDSGAYNLRVHNTPSKAYVGQELSSRKSARKSRSQAVRKIENLDEDGCVFFLFHCGDEQCISFLRFTKPNKGFRYCFALE